MTKKQIISKSAKIKKAAKKIEDAECLWTYYGAPQDGYTAGFGWFYTPWGGKRYYVSLHKEDMPAFFSKEFSNAEELAEYVLSLQPDMRRWRVV